ncbi:MAG: cation diffusion facilitator family transporter [bacterium]|nr:cation diffusion facilitator family transporter [bacterium]
MDCCNIEPRIKWVLYVAFFINAGMFFTELASGIVAHSNVLIADSLDMFGDAFVYGLSLFVLSKNHKTQARASLIKGVIMLTVGLYVLWQSFYRVFYPVVPSAQTITLIGILALVANVVCFFLLTRYRDKNINMKSAWICSRNDVYGNISVIGAGILVGYFNSMWPDIIVGMGMAGLVLYFSVKIIKESKQHIKL